MRSRCASGVGSPGLGPFGFVHRAPRSGGCSDSHLLEMLVLGFFGGRLADLLIDYVNQDLLWNVAADKIAVDRETRCTADSDISAFVGCRLDCGRLRPRIQA